MYESAGVTLYVVRTVRQGPLRPTNAALSVLTLYGLEPRPVAGDHPSFPSHSQPPAAPRWSELSGRYANELTNRRAFADRASGVVPKLLKNQP
jgi:hypothetical protein